MNYPADLFFEKNLLDSHESDKLTLDVTHLIRGLYVLKIVGKAQTHAMKFVKE